MDTPVVVAMMSFIGLTASGVGVWVALRERLVKAETKIELLERQQVDHKSEVQLLREWLDGQFSELRKVLDRKADR